MYREQIEAYMEAHKQEMLDDICTLCRVNSEKMSYKEGMPFGEGAFHALKVALGMAEGYGFSINNYDNFVGTIDLNDKEKQLDILAHLDVVPAGEGWKITEPFEPVVIDGRIYGRGTADDKGPAVAALYAMRAVKELGIPVNKNVRLILGTDEECGSSDIPHYYSLEEEAPMTFSPDAEYPVINIEKGSLDGHFTAEWDVSGKLPRVVSIDAGIKINVVPGKAFALFEGLEYAAVSPAAEVAEKKTGIRFQLEEVIEGGFPYLRVTALGKGAHASTPAAGANALTGLLTLICMLPFAPSRQLSAIHALAELMPHNDTGGEALGIAMKDELSGSLTLAFSLLSVTDSGLDGFFDSRCPICSNEENVLKVVKANMAKRGLTLLNETMRKPHHVSADSDFVRTLLRVYEEYSKNPGECQAIGGGTYVHDLKNGVAFGAALPGIDHHMHGADEFAVVEELVMSAKIFAQVIADLCICKDA